MNNQGEIKLADFGLARYHLAHNTKLTKKVVTQWYRAPELFFGERNYSNKIDMWAVGCIMAEILTRTVLFDGQQEKDQMEKIYTRLGPPEESWEECKNLPDYNEMKYFTC